MVNNSGLFEFFPLLLAEAFDPAPWQPTNTNIIADMPANTVKLRERCARIFMAGSLSPPLPSVAPTPSYRSPTPGGRPTERTGSCARHRENPAGWQHRVYTHTR